MNLLEQMYNLLKNQVTMCSSRKCVLTSLVFHEKQERLEKGNPDLFSFLVIFFFFFFFFLVIPLPPPPAFLSRELSCITFGLIDRKKKVNKNDLRPISWAG